MNRIETALVPKALLRTGEDISHAVGVGVGFDVGVGVFGFRYVAFCVVIDVDAFFTSEHRDKD